MGAKDSMNFGWRVNAGADGFEQSHGRYTMEVFWNEKSRLWTWIVWAPITDTKKVDQLMMDQGSNALLIEAKNAALRSATRFERTDLERERKAR